MSSPTKADLTAAVTKLTEENEALRELLRAVQALAAVPKPAAYSDRYYWECTDRLSTIAVWADPEDAAGPYAVQIIQGWAKAVCKKAAEPVRYEVAAAANPPHHVTADAERMCQAPDNKDAGYICTAQDGHDGPVHVAYGKGDAEVHRWPAAARCDRAEAATADPYERERADGDADYAAMSRYCQATTDLDECFTLYCDREAGHPGSHHAPGPDEGSEVAWSDEAATAVTA